MRVDIQVLQDSAPFEKMLTELLTLLLATVCKGSTR